MTYKEKLLDHRWQKKRLEIFQRDEFKCQYCDETTQTLHVHHKYYKPNIEPWDYPNTALLTLCSDCHESEHNYKEQLEKDFIILLYDLGLINREFNSLISEGPIFSDIKYTKNQILDNIISIIDRLRLR